MTQTWVGGISSDFTPVMSLVGGIIIGLAGSLYLYLLGRIMGVSGIVKGNPATIIMIVMIMLLR